MLHSHKDLIVWQKAMELVVEVYDLVAKFPREELYGLTSQIRRSAVSMPSNIAEGRGRGTRKDFKQFLNIAYASGAELETQLEISRRLKFMSSEDSTRADDLLEEVMKMLNKMRSTLNI